MTLPESVTRVLDDPEIRTQLTTDAPTGQCTWCQTEGTLCAASITWVPRPDVMSAGAAESCLTCLHLPLRWALDDALTDSIVTVEIAGGVSDVTSWSCGHALATADNAAEPAAMTNAGTPSENGSRAVIA